MSETNTNVGRHWVIFNPKGDTPARMHKTYHSAENEARRLAEKHIGDEFIIYEAVASTCLQAQVKRINPFASCVWREDEDGGWATGCGETFGFEYEGPRQHLHYFCANCGKPIDEVKYEGEEDK